MSEKDFEATQLEKDFVSCMQIIFTNAVQANNGQKAQLLTPVLVEDMFNEHKLGREDLDIILKQQQMVGDAAKSFAATGVVFEGHVYMELGPIVTLWSHPTEGRCGVRSQIQLHFQEEDENKPPSPHAKIGLALYVIRIQKDINVPKEEDDNKKEE